MDNSLQSVSLQLDDTIRELISSSEEELRAVLKRIDELNIALQGKEMQTERSENEDFQVAKDERDMKNAISNLLAVKIESLQNEIGNYTPNGFITLGTTVDLKVMSVNERVPDLPKTKFIFKLVQHATADAKKQLVAIDSKVGLAIVGHQAGDIVTATTPMGLITYKIERIY